MGSRLYRAASGEVFIYSLSHFLCFPYFLYTTGREARRESQSSHHCESLLLLLILCLVVCSFAAFAIALIWFFMSCLCWDWDGTCSLVVRRLVRRWVRSLSSQCIERFLRGACAWCDLNVNECGCGASDCGMHVIIWMWMQIHCDLILSCRDILTYILTLRTRSLPADTLCIYGCHQLME